MWHADSGVQTVSSVVRLTMMMEFKHSYLVNLLQKGINERQTKIKNVMMRSLELFRSFFDSPSQVQPAGLNVAKEWQRESSVND